MTNLFAGQKGAPYHLSVGAVVVNKDGKICCRHHQTDEHQRPVDGYVLMRETVEDNEPLEKAVERGLQEEFGLRAKILEFIGPVVSHYGYQDYQVEKTTLFFLCQFEEIIDGTLAGFESSGTLEWHDADFLIEKNIAQARQLQRDDVDDSIALERARKIINKGGSK